MKKTTTNTTATTNSTSATKAQKLSLVSEMTAQLDKYSFVIKDETVIKVKDSKAVVLICAIRRASCTFYAHSNVIDKLQLDSTVTVNILKDCCTFVLSFDDSKALLKKLNKIEFSKKQTATTDKKQKAKKQSKSKK